MRLIKNKILYFFLIFSIFSFAQEYDKEEILKLKELGIISEEDYEILVNSEKIEGYLLCDLSINGISKSKTYEIFMKEKAYFPIKSFFKNIDFTHYVEDNDGKRFEIYLGESLKKIEINILKKMINIPSEKKSILLNESDFYILKNDLYLSEVKFKEIFLSNLNFDKERYKINMKLSFHAPEDIDIRLKHTHSSLENQRNVNELLYTNDSKLFELGYIKTQINGILRKNEYTNNKYERDWEGDLEYQGAFLYGELTTGYNLRDQVFKDFLIRYDDIWDYHTFEIGNYQSSEIVSREYGVSFRKDRGYIREGEKNYIIRENVPIGSRVELLYLGFPIEVQDEDGGVVEFRNSEIKGDREYTLKIYEPSGKIEIRTVATTTNYNQQNKGQFEYDISVFEDHSSKKYKTKTKTFYGLTDYLTLGLEYRNEPKKFSEKYRSIDTGRVEAIYSNHVKSYPYTFVLGGDKIFNNIYEENGKNLKDKYSYDFLGQLDIKDVRLKFKEKKYGNYYDEKRKEEYSIRYRPLSSLEFQYAYEHTKDHDRSRESDGIFNFNYSKIYKNLLISTEYETRRNGKDEYALNFYYNGWRSMSTRWENVWKNDGKDFETALILFNSSFRAVDYTLEARYSERTKELLTFSFSLNYDNWLSFEAFINKKGDQEYKVGLDRVTDLKNPRARIENMDSSRVKVITFIDLNNDNIWGEEEPRIDNVEIKIGNQIATTDDNGETIFYGVPNDVVYNLKPTIKKPSFLLGNNKIKVKGKNSSTLVAYIPIKPMLNLTGVVNIDNELEFTSQEKIKLYHNLLITIKDINGKILDKSMPDNMGVFEVSGLFPEKYFIEVVYLGHEHKIKGLDEIIQLTYVDRQDQNIFHFNISDTMITLLDREEEI